MTTILSQDIFTAGFIAQGPATVLTPTNDYEIANKLYADTKSIPIGSTIMYMGTGSTPPTGWLFCSGQTVSRTTYAALFGVIGITFGAGDGSTTFTLPSIRAMVGQGSGVAIRTHLIKI